MYYDLFYEMKQYVSIYPEQLDNLKLEDLRFEKLKLENLKLKDLKNGCKGGYENGNVNDGGIVCGDYRSVLL